MRLHGEKTMLWACLIVVTLSALRQTSGDEIKDKSENSKLFPVIPPFSPMPECRTYPFCYLMDRVKPSARGVLELPYIPPLDFSSKDQIDRQGKNYHTGYGPTAHYYPAVDPISVLASLAFLAFLLQSFASFFDRSRNFIPGLVSSREKNEEEKVSELAKRVLRALNEYKNLNKITNDDDDYPEYQQEDIPP